MATFTGSLHLIMINPGFWRPGGRGVASFTVVGGIDMARIFTCCRAAVMAAFTCADNLCMVNLGSRSPVAVYVTAFTTVSGVDVC